MVEALTALLYLVVAGLLPAVALTGSVSLGLPCSAAVMLIVSALSGSFATIASVSATTTLLVALVLVNVVALAWLAVRARDLGPRLRRVSARRTGVVVWLLALPVVLLTVRPPAPLAWDARSIWWFHASWFLSGGEAVRDALANPLVAFSQTDYPVGNPTAIAGLWRLLGNQADYEQAQALSAVMTAFALGLLALVLAQRNRADEVVAVTLALVGAVQFGSNLAAFGYLDVLCASLLVTSLVASLLVVDARRASVLFALGLAAAASTKKEGVAFGLLVVAVAVVFAPGRRRRLVVSAVVAMTPAVVWRIALGSTGAEIKSDVRTAGVVRLTQAESLRRLRVAGPEVIAGSAGLLVPAIVVCGLVAVALWRRSSRRGLGAFAELYPAMACCVTALGAVALLSVVYAVNEMPLEWWLSTSIDRVTATPRLLALAAMCATVPVAVDLVRHAVPSPSATPTATPREPEETSHA